MDSEDAVREEIEYLLRIDGWKWGFQEEYVLEWVIDNVDKLTPLLMRLYSIRKTQDTS